MVQSWLLMKRTGFFPSFPTTSTGSPLSYISFVATRWWFIEIELQSSIFKSREKEVDLLPLSLKSQDPSQPLVISYWHKLVWVYIPTTSKGDGTDVLAHINQWFLPAPPSPYLCVEKGDWLVNHSILSCCEMMFCALLSVSLYFIIPNSPDCSYVTRSSLGV